MSLNIFSHISEMHQTGLFPDGLPSEFDTSQNCLVYLDRLNKRTLQREEDERKNESYKVKMCKFLKNKIYRNFNFFVILPHRRNSNLFQVKKKTYIFFVILPRRQNSNLFQI